MSIAIDKAISAFNTLTGEKLGKAQADLLRSLVVAAQRYEAPAEPAERRQEAQGWMDTYVFSEEGCAADQVVRAADDTQLYTVDAPNLLLIGQGALDHLNAQMRDNERRQVVAGGADTFFCGMRVVFVRGMDGFLPLYDPVQRAKRL